MRRREQSQRGAAAAAESVVLRDGQLLEDV